MAMHLALLAQIDVSEHAVLKVLIRDLIKEALDIASKNCFVTNMMHRSGHHASSAHETVSGWVWDEFVEERTKQS